MSDAAEFAECRIPSASLAALPQEYDEALCV